MCEKFENLFHKILQGSISLSIHKTIYGIVIVPVMCYTYGCLQIPWELKIRGVVPSEASLICNIVTQTIHNIPVLQQLIFLASNQNILSVSVWQHVHQKYDNENEHKWKKLCILCNWILNCITFAGYWILNVLDLQLRP